MTRIEILFKLLRMAESPQEAGMYLDAHDEVLARTEAENGENSWVWRPALDTKMLEEGYRCTFIY